jgi:hypothetical protein
MIISKFKMLISQIGRGVDNFSEGGQWSRLLCSNYDPITRKFGSCKLLCNTSEKKTSAEFTAITVAKYHQNFSADLK